MGKAYYNYRYQYLPSLADLDEQAQQLELYVDNLIANGEVQAADREEMLEFEIQSSLYQQFKKVTDINTNLNLKKLEFLRKVGIWVLATLVFGTVCMIPVLFGKSDEVQKVKIIETIDKEG